MQKTAVPKVKIYHDATITKELWCWYKDEHINPGDRVGHLAKDKSDTALQMGEGSISRKRAESPGQQYTKKISLDPYLTPLLYTSSWDNVNSMYERLNKKFPEGSLGENSHGFGIGKVLSENT